MKNILICLILWIACIGAVCERPMPNGPIPEYPGVTVSTNDGNTRYPQPDIEVKHGI